MPEPSLGPSVPFAVASTAVRPTDALFAVLVAAVLAAVHVFTPGLRYVDSLPHSWVVSLGGGVSVAYVFVHLLPEVTAARDAVLEESATASSVDAPLFLVALSGFVTFYGLEHVVRARRDPSTEATPDSPDGVFWVHVGSFAVYNTLLGYLIVEKSVDERASVLLFAGALALHLLVNDHALREDHADLYHRIGRWLLATAVAVGALLGLFVHVPEAVFGVLVAFLAGSIVLNVVKEEVPNERENQFPAFAAGAVGYTVILLVV